MIRHTGSGQRAPSGRVVRAAVFVLAMIVFAHFTPDATGCATCSLPVDTFRFSHPQSLQIAMATRSAIDAGTLPPLPSEVRKGVRGLIAEQEPSATHLVQSWVTEQEFHNREEPVTIHFLFIDTHDACGLALQHGAAVQQAELSAESDLRIVTTTTTFKALIQEHIDMSDAREGGLLIAEGAHVSLADIIVSQCEGDVSQELSSGLP